MNNAVTTLLMMGLMMAVGVRPLLTVPGSNAISGALSGYADGAWWTLLVVVYYGFIMKKTGLAERIAYYILSLFPGTYAGILSAFFLIGLLLAYPIPSMTVRTAIMAPIAWSLVQTLGLAPRSRGCALIMITVVEMAVVPGLAFELGSLNGPVVVSMFAAKNLPLSQLGYIQVMTVPVLVMCALILALNLLFFKPETPIRVSREFGLGKLRALGPFKRAEAITAVVVLISIALWVTSGKLHTLPTFVVGMFGLTVLALAGILQDQDIGTGVSWTLLLFLGGIFQLDAYHSAVQDHQLARGNSGAARSAADRYANHLAGGGGIDDAGNEVYRSNRVYRHPLALEPIGGCRFGGRSSAAGAGSADSPDVRAVLAAVHEFLDGHGGRHDCQTRVQ